MIKLTTLLNEENDSNEKIETQELADHFRNWLIEEDSGLTRYDFLMTPEQAKLADEANSKKVKFDSYKDLDA